MIRVALAGATGKMGREVVKTLQETDGMQLVAATGRRGVGEDVGTLVGLPPVGVALSSDLRAALQQADASVLVDFTAPDQVMENVTAALELGLHCVVGTTGVSNRDWQELDQVARPRGLGVLVVPNFSIGAVLMMRFAREAARHLPHVEIVELHHDQKKDAPSGTALMTAQLLTDTIAEKLGQGVEDGAGATAHEEEPARGMGLGPVRIHSVRLPGLVAHQEVLLGGPGQVLTLRHDAFNRQCFMPGVVLAIRRVSQLPGVTIGLESLLFSS